MIYADCAICEKSCKSLPTQSEDCQTVECHPGCVCPEGLYRTEEDTCVEMQDCDCYYDGKMYEANEKFIQDGHTW